MQREYGADRNIHRRTKQERLEFYRRICDQLKVEFIEAGDSYKQAKQCIENRDLLVELGKISSRYNLAPAVLAFRWSPPTQDFLESRFPDLLTYRNVSYSLEEIERKLSFLNIFQFSYELVGRRDPRQFVRIRITPLWNKELDFIFESQNMPQVIARRRFNSLEEVVTYLFNLSFDLRTFRT